jgi:hypothetical protein
MSTRVFRKKLVKEGLIKEEVLNEADIWDLVFLIIYFHPFKIPGSSPGTTLEENT